MKKPILLLTLVTVLFIVISCKESIKKEASDTTIQPVIEESLPQSVVNTHVEYDEDIEDLREATFKTYSDSYSTTTTLAVYDGPTLEDTKIDEISFGEEFVVKQIIPIALEEHENTVQWIRISYNNDDAEKKQGYVIDENIVYPASAAYFDYYDEDEYDGFDEEANEEYEEEIETTEIDTLYVSNTADFMRALGSDRVIYINAKTLDLNEYKDPESGYVKQLEGYSHLTLQNLSNIQIIGVGTAPLFRGLDQPKQLYLYNCKDVVISNIVIEGNRMTKNVEGDDIDAAVYIESSNNIILNNIQTHNDTGIPIDIYDASNVVVENSVFKNTSNIAFQSKKTSDIYVKNSDVLNSDLFVVFNTVDKGEINFNNGLIINNNIKSFLSCYSENDELNNIVIDETLVGNNTIEDHFFSLNNDTNLSFRNSLIINNKLAKQFFSLVLGGAQEPENSLLFSDCLITSNESLNSDYLCGYESSGYTNTIDFYNTKLSRNTNFKGFTKNNSSSSLIKYNSQSTDINVYITDNQITDDNSKTFESKKYLYNSNGSYSYRDNKVWYRHKPLEDGAYCFRNSFLKPKWYCCTSKDFDGIHSRHFNYAYGKVKDGYIDGVWKVVNDKKHPIQIMMELPYKQGILNGISKKYIVKEDDKILIEEGYINNNSKDGEWVYYYPNGNLRKKEYFNAGNKVGAMILYYPSGKLMEEREHRYNKNGVTRFYYENGQLESSCTYSDNALILEQSEFYTENGKSREVTIQKDEGKNTNIAIKNGIVFLEGRHLSGYSGFQSIKEGKQHGIKRYTTSLPDRERATYNEVNNYHSARIYEFYNQNNIPYKKIVLDANYDMYKIYEYDLSNNTVLLKQFDGAYGILNIIENNSINNDGKLIKNGAYERYHFFGKNLVEKGQYKNDLKDGEWISYDSNEDFEPYLKETYKNGESINRENIRK